MLYKYLLYPILCFLDKFNIHILLERPEKRMQDILNRVIDIGCYSDSGFTVTNAYMCSALSYAVRCKAITSEEQVFAVKEIKRYLGDCSFLLSKLRFMGKSCKFPDCLAVYRKWSERPFK